MKVMHTDEDSQDNVVLGRQGKTQSFRVSEDPMMMGMLSTALYSNPLKTMLQEVICNAWDAHKASGIVSKPIHVTITEDTGITIRDFGKGIPEEDMHAIYCVYGQSTKRDDGSQTGGFGLGSKSPFAYTDSFTVTSCCNGVRTIYLVSRSSDDAEGKPGISKLVSSPTEDSGLTVQISLANSSDHSKAVDYVDSLLEMSGIYMLLNVGSVSPTLMRAEEIKPNETRIIYSAKNAGLYAVYGGVTYTILKKEEYAEEYTAIVEILRRFRVYVGFAPDTLSPLPSREGLNYSTHTIQTIKKVISGLKDDLMREVHRLVEDAIDGVISNCRTYDYDIATTMNLITGIGLIEGSSTWSVAQSICNPFTIFNHISSTKGVFRKEPYTNFHSNLLDAITQHPRLVSCFYSSTGLTTVVIHALLRHYPEDSKTVFSVWRSMKREFFSNHASSFRYIYPGFVAEAVNKSVYRRTKRVEMVINRKHSTAKTEALRPYIKDDSTAYFKRAYRSKNHKLTNQRLRQVPAKKVPATASIESDYLYNNKEEYSTQHTVSPSVVILARTVAELNSLGVQDMQEIVFNLGFKYIPDRQARQITIMGYVVRDNNQIFNETVSEFNKAGFRVHIVPKAVPVVRKITTTKEKKVYYKVDTYYNRSGWKGKEECTDIKYYLYFTQSQLNFGISHNLKNLLEFFIRKHYDNIAMVNHMNEVKALEKQGAISLVDKISEFRNEFFADKKKLALLASYYNLQERHNFKVNPFLDIPELRKVFHLSKPYPELLDDLRFLYLVRRVGNTSDKYAEEKQAIDYLNTERDLHDAKLTHIKPLLTLFDPYYFSKYLTDLSDTGKKKFISCIKTLSSLK